jgi:RNA polymerase sigma factor (sigma-70 family)
MMDMEDADLIRDYVRTGSEAAFAELVKRYLNLVYATARRQLGDLPLAEEVAQSVFCLLARKARSLPAQRSIAGWLYRATIFIAARTARTEHRRRRREREAAEMNERDRNPGDVWAHLSPMLDEALSDLGEKDRLAVLLRFFQGKPMREVGNALGVSEAAAKMRIGRSIERLRHFFARRGTTCSAAALAGLLAEKSAAAAPATLASGIANSVFSRAAASSAAGLSITQTLLLMAQIKLRTLVVAGVAVLLLPTVGVVTWYSSTHGEKQKAAAVPAVEAAGVIQPAGSNDPVGVARNSTADSDNAELAAAARELGGGPGGRRAPPPPPVM